MNFLTPAIHPMFESFYKKFDQALKKLEQKESEKSFLSDIFTEQSQRTNFRLYGTGLLLEIKRKNIWYISEHIIDANYQSMHHFVSDSPWDEVAFNCRRIGILESNRSTARERNKLSPCRPTWRSCSTQGDRSKSTM